MPGACTLVAVVCRAACTGCSLCAGWQVCLGVGGACTKQCRAVVDSRDVLIETVLNAKSKQLISGKAAQQSGLIAELNAAVRDRELEVWECDVRVLIADICRGRDVQINCARYH